MALNTSITRDGEPLMLRWNGWHLQCMAAAITQETAPDLWREYLSYMEALDIIDRLNERPSLEATALDKLGNIIHARSSDIWTRIWENVREQNMFEGYVLEEDHTYNCPVPSDMLGVTAGEVLELKAGDVLWMNV